MKSSSTIHNNTTHTPGPNLVPNLGPGLASNPANSTASPQQQNRRLSSDRRTFSVQTMWYCLTSPRRSKGRRNADRAYPLVDIFGSTEMFLAITLMVLSLMDATFTLTLISRGGSELNPVMNYFLMMGNFEFVTAKVILTAIPALILIIAGNYQIFGRMRVRTITAAAIGCYAGLIVYELCLLSLA